MRATFAAIALLASCLVASCGARGGDTVTVTGYRIVSVPRGTSGPIANLVTGAQAGTIATLVAALHPGHVPACMEPAGLIYRLDFHRVRGTAASLQVTGYRCGAAVSVLTGGTTHWYRDTTCSLDNEIRHSVLPAAKATRSQDVGCDGPA